MKISPKLSLVALAIGSLSACTSISTTAPSGLHTASMTRAETIRDTPRVFAPVDRVTESSAVHIPVIARKVSEYAWLRAKKVTINSGKDPVPMSEVLRSLSKQGLSITSELPLDRFMYAGFSLNDIDAESALRAVVSSVGLDYQVDDARKLIMIKPLSSKTWYLNIGNRRSNFTSGASVNTAAAKGGSGTDSGITGSGGNVTAVNSSDDFWTSLKAELDSRLHLMLPDPKAPAAAAPVAQAPSLSLPPLVSPAGAAAVPGVPGTPQVAGPQAAATPAQVAAASGATSDGILNFTSKQVGSFSVNPETGAVTVQAPHWVLQDLNAYFKRVQEMYNTDILFQGELILLTTADSKTEGLDISSFGQFAKNRYNFSYSNNSLGGLTLSADANGIPTIAAATSAISSQMLGIASVADGLAVFNAYLTNLGTVTTLQKPMLTTTSGVPSDFRKIVTRYFNSVSQEVAPGTNGGASVVTTKNTLVAQDYGTVLRVNPRYDISTGLIRAQIELVQTTQTGTQTIPQAVSAGSNIQLIPASLPIVSKVIYSGEALLKNGDLIVMGGQVEDEESISRDGVSGLMDVAPVSGVFGKNSLDKKHNVFYFAMKVSVNKR